MFRLPHIDSRYARSFQALAPTFFLGLLVLTVLFHPYLPADDALRHVVSYAWGYSHRAMYPLSSLPDYNLYPSFDVLVGWLSQQIGPLGAIKALQALALLLAVVACYRIARQALPNDDRAPLDATAIVLLLLAAGLFHRTMLARPEVFAFGWAALVASARGQKPLLTATLVILSGWLVSSGYWMAWVYWPLLLLAPFGIRWKALVSAALVAGHLVFWHIHSDGNYWTLFEQLTAWNEGRLLVVSENLGLLSALSLPLVWLYIGLAALGVRGRPVASLPRWHGVAAAAFLAVNMVRYLPALFVTFMGAVAHGWRRLELSAGVSGLICLSLWLHVLQSTKLEQAPAFKLPQGSRVLTTFGPATFALPFYNPGGIETLPAMEVGASDARVQRLALAVREGGLDCRALAEVAATHVVEQQWKGAPPPCLALRETLGPWRLWEVTGHPRD